MLQSLERFSRKYSRNEDNDKITAFSATVKEFEPKTNEHGGIPSVYSTFLITK